MYSQKANSSSLKFGQKLKSSANTLGKKSIKAYNTTKDGHNSFNHQSLSPLEKIKHERH